MTAGVEALAADRAFCEVIGQPSLQHAEVRDAIDQFARRRRDAHARAREQGPSATDITGTDIVLLLGGIQQTAAPLLGAQPEVWRRYLELAFDGLSPTNTRTLPHRPPDHLQLIT